MRMSPDETLRRAAAILRNDPGLLAEHVQQLSLWKAAISFDRDNVYFQIFAEEGMAWSWLLQSVIREFGSPEAEVAGALLSEIESNGLSRRGPIKDFLEDLYQTYDDYPCWYYPTRVRLATRRAGNYR